MAANGSELVKLSQLKRLSDDMGTKFVTEDAADGKYAPIEHTHEQADVTGLTNALAGKANTSHTHTTAQVTGLDTALAGKANTSHTHEQGDIDGLGTALAGKANASHTHTIAQVTGLQDALNDKPDSLADLGISATAQELNYMDGVIDSVQTQLNGKAASSHNHSAADITSGTLPVARGGTGVTANPSMLVNLASTAADTVFEATPRPGVTGTLPIARGGTGATSASAAREALDAAASNHTHSNATTSAAGFMSAADKTKLDGLSNESYTLPQASDTVLGGVKFPTATIAQGYLGY